MQVDKVRLFEMKFQLEDYYRCLTRDEELKSITFTLKQLKELRDCLNSVVLLDE